MNESNNITVIIPAFNEEKDIPLTLRELKRITNIKEIIVVDGGSLDGTPEIAEKEGATVLIQKGYGGWGQAFREGLEIATGEFIAITNAYCSYPNFEIPRFVNVLKSDNKIGAVVGSRQQVPNKFLSSFFNFLFHSSITDLTSSFIVARRNILLDLNLSAIDSSLVIEIRAKIIKKGYSIVEIPVEYYDDFIYKPHLRYFLHLYRKLIGLALQLWL
ncbi:MAG: glycosyltransferase family 2 protein [Candidatus Bathyarchaeia archaeon]|jgi:dolichol-phosphate mannosyltransferase